MITFTSAIGLPPSHKRGNNTQEVFKKGKADYKRRATENPPHLLSAVVETSAGEEAHMLTAVRLQRLVGTNSPLAQPRRAVTASMAPKKRTRRTEPADEERNDDAHSGGSATPAEPAETGQKGAKKQKNQQSEKAVVDRDPTPRENPLPRE